MTSIHLVELNTILLKSHINALLMDPLALWNAHSVQVDKKLMFVDCKMFEVIAEKRFTNKYRKFEKIIDEAFAGCGLKTKDLRRRIPMEGQSKPTVYIAVSNFFSNHHFLQMSIFFLIGAIIVFFEFLLRWRFVCFWRFCECSFKLL